MNVTAIIAALSLTLCVNQIAYAQQASDTSGPAGQSMKGAQLKNKAPINAHPLRIHLPKPIEARLSNGLRIVLIEDHKLPTLYMQCVLLERGDAADSKDKQGVAHATAVQLREGTTTRSARELSEQLDTLGGSLSGMTSTLDAYVTVTGLSEHLDPLIALLTDVILRPTFPEPELERYKTRYVSQLQAQRATPVFVAREKLYRAIYGEHPAGTIAPSDEQVRRITVADLKSFHDKYYRPNATLMFVTGDVTMKQLLPKLEQALHEWKANDEQLASLPDVVTPDNAQVFVIDRPGSVQTSLLLGALGIKGDDADRYALSVLNQVLGYGPASRLFMNLREDKGYTYGAYSGVSMGRYPGVVVANAEVRTDVTDNAMKEFMREFKRLASEPVDAVELANAKRAIVGRFALALEDPRTFMSYIFEQKIYGFPAGYWDHYAERVDAVTAADVQRVAAKYFDPKRMQIVAVGDATKIKDAMAKFE